MAYNRTTRRLALEVCEWKAEPSTSEREAQRLARSRPTGTSPLSMVALPQLCVTPIAVRHVANLSQLSPIANPAQRGTVQTAAACTSAGELNPLMALPQPTGLGLSFAFGLSFHAFLKSLSVQTADRKNAAAASGPCPSPLRVQPASMLVLPGLSLPVSSIRWGASGRWAIVASARPPKMDQVQVSPSEQSSLSSPHCLTDGLRVDPAVNREFTTLRLTPQRPAISLDLGAQTSAHGVPAANALPRRRGPKLPVVTPQLDGLIAGGR